MKNKLGLIVFGLASAFLVTLQAQEAAPVVTIVEAPLSIHIARDKGQMGSLCSTELYVDGILLGQLTPGQSTTINAPPGAKELMARPALESYLCKKFYTTPQWEVRTSLAGLAGPSVAYRYGFSGKGVPFMEPASP